MIPYYLILFIPLLFATTETISGKQVRERKNILLFFSLTLILFIGLRSNGYDYKAYHDIYDSVNAGIINKSWDSAFVWICRICPSFHFMLLLMGALSIFPLYWVIKHQSPFVFFSLLIFITTFLFPTIMGQMRQGVAMCLMLYAYYNWRDNKIKFLIIWLFCCFLHSSAPIALLLLLIPKRLFPLKNYILLIGFALIVCSVLRPIFAPFLHGLSMLQDTVAMDRLEFYNATETEQGITIGLNSAMVIRIFTFLLAFKILKNEWYKDASIINIYFLSIFIYLILGFIPQLGGRGSQYFAVFDCILIPCTLKHCKTYHRQVFALVFILISILRFNQFFSDDFTSRYYVPYQIEIAE